MEVAGFVVSVVPAAVQYGNTLVQLYLSLRNAYSELEERVTKVICHWRRTMVQLDFMQRTWTNLHEEIQNYQLETLAMLKSKLKSAVHKLQGLLKQGKVGIEQIQVKRFKYIFIKPYLDAVIHDLAEWQKQYDPSWFLIMKIASPAIDVELKRRDPSRTAEGAAVLRSASKVREALNPALVATNVFLPPEDGAEISSIPCSSAILLRRSRSNATFIVDPVPCPIGSFIGAAAQDMRRLASKLRCVEPTGFGILRCRGVTKVYSNNGSKLTSFNIVFDTPSLGVPLTLRSYLMSHSTYGLTERMDVAKKLATSVSYVHTLGFVHKSIRPENILGFSNFGNNELGAFFLIGFEQIRSVDGITYMRGDDAMEKNLYRHPERQGPHPEEAYNIRHDIYSLGVCLLEIGLWNTFVQYDGSGDVKTPGAALELTADELRRKRPGSIKAILLHLLGARCQ
ncbi:hypothetical protein LTR56_015560 [Elasticomyces elasticus]|nr:hypothetical protein LTR56_015560 [Elasticomyces elasticus]KAK3648291.1 hypothetical protein LTR22_013422 [Elasticomyces elasticus]KAK4916281.1 hypothetical protein LTR49_015653 [Elasticomyces elasticus]KAK5764959.1 hypothetical protein LTS12_004987 [Elasticomyces elasticus]